MIQIRIFEPDYGGGHPLREVLGHGGDQRWFVLADVIRNIHWESEAAAVEQLGDLDLAADVDWAAIPVSDSGGQTRRARVVNLGGVIELSMRAKTPEARLFSKWVTHGVMVAVLTTGSYALSPDIPRGADANPLATFEAMLDVMKNQDARLIETDEKSDRGIVLGTEANQKADQIAHDLKNPDRLISVRRVLERDKIAYDSILNEYELMEMEASARVRGHMLSKNDFMTRAAAKVGKLCVAICLANGITRAELDARKFDAGNYAGVGRYEPEVIQQALRTIMGG